MEVAADQECSGALLIGRSNRLGCVVARVSTPKLQNILNPQTTINLQILLTYQNYIQFSVLLIDIYIEVLPEHCKPDVPIKKPHGQGYVDLKHNTNNARRRYSESRSISNQTDGNGM